MLKVYKSEMIIYKLNRKQFKLVYPYLSGLVFYQQKSNDLFRMKVGKHSKQVNEVLKKVGAVKEKDV